MWDQGLKIRATDSHVPDEGCILTVVTPSRIRECRAIQPSHQDVLNECLDSERLKEQLTAPPFDRFLGHAYVWHRLCKELVAVRNLSSAAGHRSAHAERHIVDAKCYTERIAIVVPFACMAGRGRGVQNREVRSKGRSARNGGGARVVQLGRWSHSDC